MLKNLKTLLDKAEKYQYAIPAFNVNNLEQIISIREAAVETNSPIIFQISSSADRYAGAESLISIIHHQLKDFPAIPYAIHRDHAHSIDECLKAAHQGFTSVMIDGSLITDGKTPSDFDYNIKITSQVTKALQNRGVSVEGELGVLGSLETCLSAKEGETGAEGILSRRQLVTSVEEALEFSRLTGVDALAVAVGTSHGAYKFKSDDISQYLNVSRVEEIHRALPNVHLVLHGASSIPKEWIDIINQHGGEISSAKGVPEDQLLTCLKNGIRKINIDTDLRIVFVGAQRLYLSQNKDSLDIRNILGFCIEEMYKLVKHKYLILGCDGQASKF